MGNAQCAWRKAVINMAACSFCSDNISKGTGHLYAKKDGTLYYFCSGKCRKNQLVLKREGRRQKWTKASQLFKEREKKKAAKAG